MVLKNIKDPEPTILTDFEWISENTTEKLKIPFYKAWNIVSLERNPRKIIEIQRGEGLKSKTTEITVGQIVVEVQKAHQRMFELMGRIAKKYDISIAIETSGGDSSFSLPIID